MTDPKPYLNAELQWFRDQFGYQTMDAKRALATIDRARRGDMARLKEVQRLHKQRDSEAWDVEARLQAHLPGAPGTPAERVDELAALLDQQARYLRESQANHRLCVGKLAAALVALNELETGIGNSVDIARDALDAIKTQGLNPGVENNPCVTEQPSPSTPDEWMDEWSRRASALFGYGYVASVDDRPDEFKLGEQLIADVIASTLAGVAKTETTGPCTICEALRDRLVTAEALFAGAEQNNEALSAKLSHLLDLNRGQLPETILDRVRRKLGYLLRDYPDDKETKDDLIPAVISIGSCIDNVTSPTEALRARDMRVRAEERERCAAYLADTCSLWQAAQAIREREPADDSLGTCECGNTPAVHMADEGSLWCQPCLDAARADEPRDDTALFDAVAEADLAKVAHALCGKPWHGVDGEWTSPVPCTQPVDHVGDCYRYATDEEG